MKMFERMLITLYCVDAVAALIATVLPSIRFLEKISNILSGPTSVLAVVALVLAIAGKLRPRFTFILMSGYYTLMMGFGIVLIFMVFQHVGDSMLRNPQQINLGFLYREFAWYPTVHWILLGLWLVVAACGLMTYLRAQSAAPTQDDVA